MGVPARFVFALLGFLGFFNLYAMRVNLSVAIVAMVKESNSSNETDSQKIIACKELLNDVSGNDSENGNSSLSSTGEFEWDTTVQGMVLGAFFYGYVVTQIPGGLIAEKYGAKWLFGIGMLLTSVSTLLTAIAARWSVWALVVVRVLEGLGEGVAFPAMNTLIGQWAPKLERSRISAFIYTGGNVGTVFTLAVSGVLSDSGFLDGWPAVFYLFGTLGCLWFIPWALFISETPESHPWISAEELELIHKGKEQVQSRGPTPWKSILTSIPFLALAVSHFGQSWGFYTFFTQMPMYLSKILHFDLNKNGVLSAVPNLMLSIVSLLGSVFADKVRERGKLQVTVIRKIFNSIGFFGPAVCLVAVAFSGCRPLIIVILLSLAMGLNGFAYSGFIVTHVDMSPDFAGTLYGITNFLANMTGFLVPSYVGWIMEDGQTVKNWGIVFITASVILIISGIIYDIFCSAELQPWGVSQEAKKEDETETAVKDPYSSSSKL